MSSKRITALFLTLFMITLALVSCTNGDTKTDVTTAADDGGVIVAPGSVTEGETTASPYDANGYLLDNIPEDLKYTDKEFTIFTWSNQTVWEWDSEGNTGELLKDAIYNRKLKTEERLGIKLVIKTQAGEWENRNSFIQTVANSVLSGSGAYDLIGQYTPAAAIGAMQNIYLALNDIEYLNLNQPWWPGDITESSSINGKLYFATGDITPTLIRNMSTVMANLDLANAHNLGDLYALVDNGDWTLEKMKEIATGVVNNLNDGQQYFGVTITNNVTYDSLFYSGGFRYVDADSDGTIKLSDTIGGEKMINWYKQCQSFLNDNTDVSMLGITAAFSSGYSIFHMGQISDVQNYLKDTTMNFAILPFPKYDKAQENYGTIVGYWVTMYSIPIDAKDTAMSGAVLEVLASEGYRELTPAFYTEAFQYRYLNTEVNARMFDLLHDTLVFDTGRTFADQINMFGLFRKAATAGTEWSSTYSAGKTVWEKTIKGVYDKLG